VHIHSRALSNSAATPTPGIFIDCTKLYQILFIGPVPESSVIFAGQTVHLLQGFSFHLQLHLRILLEDFGVALPEKLRDPFVCDAAGTLNSSSNSRSARSFRKRDRSPIATFRNKDTDGTKEIVRSGGWESGLHGA
jgi:hypothetical protein